MSEPISIDVEPDQDRVYGDEHRLAVFYASGERVRLGDAVSITGEVTSLTQTGRRTKPRQVECVVGTVDVIGVFDTNGTKRTEVFKGPEVAVKVGRKHLWSTPDQLHRVESTDDAA